MMNWTPWLEASHVDGFYIPEYPLTKEPIEAETFDQACEILSTRMDYVEQVDGQWLFGGFRIRESREADLENPQTIS